MRGNEAVIDELVPFYFVRNKSGKITVFRRLYVNTEDAIIAAYEANRIFGGFTQLDNHRCPVLRIVKRSWNHGVAVELVSFKNQKSFAA